MRASSGTLCVFQRKHMRANLWPLEKTAAPAGPRHIVPLSSGMADEYRLVQPLAYRRDLVNNTQILRSQTHTHNMCCAQANAYRLKSCSILSCTVYGSLPSHSSYTLACVQPEEVLKKTRIPCGQYILAHIFPQGLLHFPLSVRWKLHLRCHNDQNDLDLLL